MQALARLKDRLPLDRIPGVRRTGPIGLDLDEGRVHALQLERSPGAVRLHAFAQAECPMEGSPEGAPPVPDPARLREALRGGRFAGRRVVTPLPADRVKLMVLNFEAEDAREEPQQILGLVEERISDPLDSCVVDYLPIRGGSETRGERSALVAVALRDHVIAYLEALRHAGLQVEALEIAPVAVRRLVTWLMRDHPDENLLVLQTGARRTSISVFWGRRLILHRETEFGEDALVEALAAGLELEPAAARAVLREYGFHGEAGDARLVPEGPSPAEIRQTLREILKSDFHRLGEAVRSALVYTASRTRGGTVEELRLLGSIVTWPGVERLLAELLELRVQRLDPLSALAGENGGRNLRGADPDRVAVAAGCALRGVSHGA